LTIRIPPSWWVTPFLGEPATVVFPLMHVSNFTLTGPCASLVPATQARSDCFGAQWSAPRGGAVLAWTDEQIPGPIEYRLEPGRSVSIGPYRGKMAVTYDARGTTIEAAVRPPGWLASSSG
jgi:hypothetical protein